MADRKLRILISSNAPFSTSGYGQQVAEFAPRLRDAGYEVAVSCFFGLEGNKIMLDGITCYPKIADTWGADAMVNHALHFKADVVMTLQDLWVVDPNALRQLKRWIPIVPIDHNPIPPAIYERLKLAYRIVTYSKFGRDELQRLGMYSTYIPHTVDTNIYKPMDKKALRKKIGVPDNMFLFGMVAANKDNPPRKSFQEAMDAFKVFHEKHPNSGMYFHTLLAQAGGFPIEEYAKFLGFQQNIYHLQPYEQLFLADKAVMASIYNCMDCLLAPSTNEGFGVPIIEAQACGVPVITNNWTAMPELVKDGKTGYICEVASKRFTPLLSYIGIPSTKSIYEKMELVFKSDREKMRDDARKHILNNYDTDKVVKERWLPFLARVKDEIFKSEVDSSPETKVQ